MNQTPVILLAVEVVIVKVVPDGKGTQKAQNNRVEGRHTPFKGYPQEEWTDKKNVP